MPTVTCTPGGASDNCYLTLAQANAYFTNGLREADWTEWLQDDRERSLIQATAEVEHLGGPCVEGTTSQRVLFSGAPVLSTQALHFPRLQDCDAAGASVVPQAIRDAVCEQAFWLLSQRDNPELIDRTALQAQGVRSVGVDGISEQYTATDLPLGISPRAWVLVKPYVQRSAPTRVRATGSSTIVRRV